MNKRTFEYNGVSVEVVALTYRKRLELAALHAELGINFGYEQSGLALAEFAARQKFAEIAAYTTKAKGLGFPWPGATAPIETLLIAMTQLFDREDSEVLVDKWLQAIDAVNGIGSDPDLLPAELYSADGLALLEDKRQDFRDKYAALFDKQVAQEEQHKQLAKEGKEPTEDYSDVQNLGLHYNGGSDVAFTLRCINFLEQFEVLPEPGGLMDQDPKRLDDMLTLKRFKEWRRNIYKVGTVEPATDGTLMDLG